MWLVAVRLVGGSPDSRMGGLSDWLGFSGDGQEPSLPTAQPPIRRSALPVLDERLRGTKFVTLQPQSVLNSPEQTGMDFWSLNPYVGCEFGCSYCYARYAHRYVVQRAHDAGKLSDSALAEFQGPNGWEAFEQRIFVKQQILAALDSDLRRFFRRVRQRPGDTIVIGTATDPYQPAERRFRLTRAVLARLAQCEGLSIGLITKSSLVARDADLFAQIQRRNDLEVHISLITLDVALIRALEARSPIPAVRLRALKRLTDAGVNAGLIVAPVLPGITDDVPRLDALFHAARRRRRPVPHREPPAALPRDPRSLSPAGRSALPGTGRSVSPGVRRSRRRPAGLRAGAEPPDQETPGEMGVPGVAHVGSL